MKTINFDFEKRISTCKISADYICKSMFDYSGTYVLASEAEAEIAALKNDLMDAVDVKEGKGPTALSIVASDRDAAVERERELKEQVVSLVELSHRKSEELLHCQKSFEAKLATAEAEIAELKTEIKDLNTELTLAIARNQLNPLPDDNMIHDEAEIRRLYSNVEYYRGLVCKIGKHFGAAAYISDDGSVQQDILCAKIPELVESQLTAVVERERVLVAELEEVRGEAADFEAKLDAAVNLLVLEKNAPVC